MALAAAVMAPFLLPYAAMRTLWDTLRPVAEVSRFSADVYSYATAFSEQRIWGDMLRAFPKPEGELFPGLVPLVLALAGIAWRGHHPRHEASGARPLHPTAHEPRGRGPGLAPQWFAWLLGAAAVLHVAAAVAVLVSRRIAWDLGWFELRMSNANQLLLRATVAAALLLLVSPRARDWLRAFLRDRGFPVAGLLVAAWLSLGPLPLAQGRPVEIAAPYRLLYEHVPGFDGLRVPARFGMIVALMLAMLAAMARTRSAALDPASWCLVPPASSSSSRRRTCPSRRTAWRRSADTRRRRRASTVPPARRRSTAKWCDNRQAACSSSSRFGQPDYDLRAMFYSTVHWHALVNGYSGVFPPHYGLLTSAFSEMPRHPDVSLDALRMSGATHAIVHEAAYLDTEGTDTSALLRNAGAVEILRDGSDVLFRLPR